MKKYRSKNSFILKINEWKRKVKVRKTIKYWRKSQKESKKEIMKEIRKERKIWRNI